VRRDIMTTRDQDLDATVKMPQPVAIPKVPEGLENADPEHTLVRDVQDDWESTAIRRVLPHVKAVDSELKDSDDARYGWETESLKRLVKEARRDETP
jgi:hypothetical protein